MAPTKQSKIVTTFNELVLSVIRYAEKHKDLHLSNFIPGDTEVVMQDQHKRFLTLSVDDKGAPSVTGELAAEIDVVAAIAEERRRAAAEAADLKRANLKDLEDAAAIAKAEQESNTTPEA